MTTKGMEIQVLVSCKQADMKQGKVDADSDMNLL